jgi:hypothetical protein
LASFGAEPVSEVWLLASFGAGLIPVRGRQLASFRRGRAGSFRADRQEGRAESGALLSA